MSAPPLSSIHEFHKKFTFHASVYRTEWWQGRPGGHKPLNKQTCKHSAARRGPSGTCACGQGALGHVPFARGMPGFPWDLGVCHLGAPSRAHASALCARGLVQNRTGPASVPRAFVPLPPLEIAPPPASGPGSAPAASPGSRQLVLWGALIHARPGVGAPAPAWPLSQGDCKGDILPERGPHAHADASFLGFSVFKC